MPAYKDKRTGKWYVSFYYKNWKDESERKMKRGFETKKEAQTWEREFLQKQNAKLNMPFASFVEIYMEDIKVRIRESTYNTKENIIRKKILPYFENKKICDIKANNLSDDLDKQLESFISEHGDTKLIIIDTLQKIREAAGENYSYGNDYDLVARLKKFTDKYSISLILVHHTRKQSADDCFDTISGTNGLLGAADGAFLLQKDKRTDNKATLDVAGRDQQDQRLKLMFDMEHCVWQLIEAETELWQEPLDEAVKAVAEFISADNPLWCGTASELIERLALDIQPNSFTRRLNVNAGRLLNEYGIQYESSRSHAGRQIKLCRINTA